MAKAAIDFDLFAWDGGCVILSSNAGIVPPHAHQAIQVVHGRGGRVRLRAGDDVPWESYDVGIVASHQLHTYDPTGVDVGFVMFVEPETREGRALTELYLAEGFGSVDSAVAAEELSQLLDLFLAHRGEAEMVEAARNVVRRLTHGVEPLAVSDDRIVRAVAWINAHLDRPITLDDVAAEVFLSPERFRHLFVEQMGMGLRPYVLWRRLMRSWVMITDGMPVSRAAHEGGFADAAHLTRTARRMIGLAPSMFSASRSALAPASRRSLPAKP